MLSISQVFYPRLQQKIVWNEAASVIQNYYRKRIEKEKVKIVRQRTNKQNKTMHVFLEINLEICQSDDHEI